ncbi:MAG: ROK family protein [Bacteroidales bacterium]|nr:ROK family protein [Bacteroidales bacterium]
MDETSLNITVLSELINELIEEGLIEKGGNDTPDGSPETELFVIKKDAFYILGIDVDRVSTQMAILNARNNSLDGFKQFDIKLENTRSFVDKIYTLALETIAELNFDIDRLMAVGIDIPGLVDPEKGANYTYLVLENESLGDILRRKFGKPVFLINDTQAQTLAELWFGKAKNKKHVLVLHLGQGLGSGMVLNGKLYYGSRGFSGEFSHIPVVENGLLCHCGKHGCLETIASGMALERLVISGLAKGGQSVISKKVGAHPELALTTIIIEAALQGDQFAIDMITEMGLQLGKGIAMLAQVLNPEMIILGGKLTQARQLLTIPLEHALNKYCLPEIKNSLKIEISSLGQNAYLIGSVINAVERHLMR